MFKLFTKLFASLNKPVQIPQFRHPPQYKQRSQSKNIEKPRVFGNEHITLTAQVQVHEFTENELTENELKIIELNKDATAFKKTDIDTSILILKEIQKLRGGVYYTETSEYLRLPLYLQQAGRMDEAMSEFLNILHSITRPHIRRDTYDKMRLSCQREKHFDESVVYGIQAIAYDFLSSKYNIKRSESDYLENKRRIEKQERKSKYADSNLEWSKENITRFQVEDKRRTKLIFIQLEGDILKLLKKAKRDDLLKPIVNEFLPFKNDVNIKMCENIGQSIRKLLV